MKRFTKTKRWMAALLSIVMLLGMVPVMPLTILAADNAAAQAETSDRDYVTLPITIRDFAADGMLFEWNELGATGTLVTGAGTPTTSIGAFSVTYTSNTLSANYTTSYLSGTQSASSVRYAVVKYKTNATYSSSKNGTTDMTVPAIGLRDSDVANYVALPTDGFNKSSYATVVVDLGTAIASPTMITIFTNMTSGKTLDVAWMAFFPTLAEANAYKTYDGVVGDTYHHGDTKGFGLLQTNFKDRLNAVNGYVELSDANLADNIAGSQYVNNGGYKDSTEPTPITVALNSGATQLVYGALVRADLVSPTLGADKKLQYTEGTVTWLAAYMQSALNEVWQNSDGSYNLFYVMGDKLFDENNNYVGKANGTKDLASVVRSSVKNNALGSYADTVANVPASITECDTWCDAAYFLLNNLYTDNDGYGLTVGEYDQIQLVAKENEDGTISYVFNSAYNDTSYDYESGIIKNTQTTDADIRFYSQNMDAEVDWYQRGNAQPKHPFNPIPELGYGKSDDVYSIESGIYSDTRDGKEYYAATNYNLTLEGHAKFVYYHDDDLYFTFTGDDDVYLYINGVRVLDLGGAHAISKATINVNDIAELCGLEDGEAYDFDFYYMERHGTAANFGIETNIRIVDPSMVTTKNVYQGNIEVGYNGFVNATEPVIYRFGLENAGEAAIYNLTFTDDTIGVQLTPDALTFNDETTVDDLVVTRFDANGVATEYFNLTEAELKQMLKDGLGVGEKIWIWGFNYTIPWGNDTTFPNTVYTTSTADYDNTDSTSDVLTGYADCLVQKAEYKFDPITIYTWGRLDKNGNLTEVQPVTLYKNNAELLKPILEATDVFGDPLLTSDVASYNLTIGNISGSAANWTAAHYNSPVLKFETDGTSPEPYPGGRGKSFVLGNIDLGNYSAIEITYGMDPSAPPRMGGSQFYLTTSGSIQNTDGSINSNVTVLGSCDFDYDNSVHWGLDENTVTIPLSTNYSGSVSLSCLKMYADGTTVGKDGVAVSSIKLIGKKANNITLSSPTIELASASGNPASTAINKAATLNSDDSITYTPTKTGSDTYHYIVKDGSKTYGAVAVRVFTYGIADNTFVLDYNLPVVLDDNTNGFMANDVLYVVGSPEMTTTFDSYIKNSEDYGTFTTNSESDLAGLTYTMNKFMNGTDSVKFTITIKEAGATEVNKFTGVTMTDQTITVVPANVVYYEDDFADITYINSDGALADGSYSGNVWAYYEGPNKGSEQSADQTSNYGSDPNYDHVTFKPYLNEDATAAYLNLLSFKGLVGVDDADLAETIPGMIDDATLYSNYFHGNIATTSSWVIPGDASNDTLHALSIKNTSATPIMQFEFCGDGFEIVSRTTTYAYAVLTVKIEQKQTDGSYKLYKMIPVITECINGDLYQVPVIARKDLDYATYRVTVSTANASGTDRMVYVDGVRVYRPLSAEDQETYYNNTEANATFHEIKTEINSGYITFGEAHPTTNVDDKANWTIGATLIETNRNNFDTTLGDNDQYADSNLMEEYLKFGPNNEIYLSNRTASFNFIAFYLEKDESVADADRSIQVGAHYKYTTESLYTATPEFQHKVSMKYGGTAEQILFGANTVEVESGTEQYYTIDTATLKETTGNDGGKRYMLIIGIDDNDGTTAQEVLALTNLKLKGYKLVGDTATEMAAVVDVYDAYNSPIMAETLKISDYYADKAAALAAEEN